nr:uncharacterized protein LOC106618852 [Bactrocera oleae]
MRCQLLALGIFVALLSFAYTAQVCVLDMRNCRRQKNVCARFGQSNLCQSFSNYCALQSANCQHTAQYTVVNSSLCSQLSNGVRGFCLRQTGGNSGTGGVGGVGGVSGVGGVGGVGGVSGFGSVVNGQPILLRD